MEFTVHVGGEYDYRFVTEKRKEIIEILKIRHFELKNSNLPIFGIDRSNLREFTTTEKDMKRGNNRYPPNQFRIKSEDLVNENHQSLEINKTQEETNPWTMDDYQDNVKLRN